VDADELLGRIRRARDRAQERQDNWFRLADEAQAAGDNERALAAVTEAARQRSMVVMLEDVLGE
jgi:predicted TPR repeat methyltransferase